MATTMQNPGPGLKKRLASIDVLRGVTVGFMILVNNNGNNDLAYRALNHSPWNGFTPTDLVFPTFLFIMGISLVLSSARRLNEGTSRGHYMLHVVRRFLLLFLFGLIVNGFPYFHLHTLRIYGVLQRIAICYLLASLLLLVTRKLAPMVVLTLSLLVGYWVLMRWVPVPGHGMPVRDFPLLDPNINLVAWLDRHIFPGRLYEGTRDPEGLLSDLPSFATTLIGMIVGLWLQRPSSHKSKAVLFAAAAVVLLIAGYIWGFSFPINKRLWTSSYVLFAGGWSLLLLSAAYYVFEVRRIAAERAWPALVFGMNAITAYVFSELLSSAVANFHATPSASIQVWVYSHIFQPIVNPAFGSLVYSLVFVLVCWLVVLPLYRKKIFLKL
jgi:predicted acyltransferase